LKHVGILVIAIFSGLLTLGCETESSSSSSETVEVCNASDKDGLVKVAGMDFSIGDWVAAGPLEGAVICANAETPVAGDLVIVTGSKEGYFPFHAEINVPEKAPATPIPFVLAPDSIVETINATLGQTVDPEKGHLTVSIAGMPNDAGVSTAISAVKVSFDGKAQVGPKYFNPTSRFALGIFGDDAAGTTDSGIGVYFNVDPGEVTTKIDVKGYNCKANTSGTDTADGGIKMSIVAGKVSYITVQCEAEDITFTTKAKVYDFATNQNIEGATVCLNDAKGDDCLTSDKEGAVESKITYKLGDTLTARGDAENYAAVLIEGLAKVYPAEDAPPFQIPMIPNTMIGLVEQGLSIKADEAMGHTIISVVGPQDDKGERAALAGATLTMSKNEATGPKYFNTLEKILAGALFGEDGDGTTDAGGGAVFNLKPGKHTVTASAKGHTCYPGAFGIPNADGGTDITIEAGRITYIAIICDK